VAKRRFELQISSRAGQLPPSRTSHATQMPENAEDTLRSSRQQPLSSLRLWHPLAKHNEPDGGLNGPQGQSSMQVEAEAGEAEALENGEAKTAIGVR
jgi:hypothetical protein